jgi:hypothetical protein
MIKLFRKIRYDLMEKNKTGKYLKYAIGEVVLVVIGIIIALQINNWNENRTKLKEEQNIIFNLNAEFKNNLIQLDTTVLYMSKTIKGLDSILQIMSKNISFDDKPESFDRLLNHTLVDPQFSPSSIVLKELEGSGKLAILKNKKLKTLLYKWNLSIDATKVTEATSNKSYNDIFDYLKANASLRRIDYSAKVVSSQTILSQSNRHLLTDLKFENALDDHYILTSNRHRAYQKLVKVINEIIKQTESSYNH